MVGEPGSGVVEFATDSDEEEELWSLRDLIKDPNASITSLKASLEAIRKDERRIYEFNTGNGRTIVWILPLTLIILGIAYQILPSLFAKDLGGGRSLSYLLGIVILGQWAYQYILAQRMKGFRLTRADFEMQSIINRRQGRPFQALEGYDTVRDLLRSEYLQSLGHRAFGMIAIINYLITFVGAILLAEPYGYSELTALVNVEAAPALLALSAGMGTGMTMVVWGLVLSDDTPDFDASQPLGLLEAYSPSGHPTFLDQPFHQSIKGLLEPGAASYWEKYETYLNGLTLDSVDDDEAMERLLFLLHLEGQHVLTREDVVNEASEVFEPTQVESILQHTVFDADTLKRLIQKARSQVPALHRIIDRLEYSLTHSLTQMKNEKILFDAEIGRLIKSEKGNLVVFLASRENKDLSLSVEVTAPRMRPSSRSLKVSFTQSQCIQFPDVDQLTLTDGQNEDLSHMMGQLLHHGVLVWITLQPAEKGAGFVEVSVLDEEGGLVAGKTMRVVSRKDHAAALKSKTGKAGIAGGALVPILKAAPSLRRLFGLP